jgi:hypothetical protein
MHVPDPPAAKKAKPAPPEKAPLAPGTPPSGGDSGTALPMPHERDERMDTASAPDPLIAQAGRDLAEGQVDTDLRATPGLDAERRERIVRPPRGRR